MNGDLRRATNPVGVSHELSRSRTVYRLTNNSRGSIDEVTVPEDDGHIHPADYTWRDIVRIAFGGVMVVLGVLGLVFPILNGTLFLIIAAFVLAPYSRRIRRLLDRAERRFPALFGRARAFGRRWLTCRRRYE